MTKKTRRVLFIDGPHRGETHEVPEGAGAWSLPLGDGGVQSYSLTSLTVMVWNHVIWVGHSEYFEPHNDGPLWEKLFEVALDGGSE